MLAFVHIFGYCFSQPSLQGVPEKRSIPKDGIKKTFPFLLSFSISLRPVLLWHSQAPSKIPVAFIFSCRCRTEPLWPRCCSLGFSSPPGGEDAGRPLSAAGPPAPHLPALPLQSSRAGGFVQPAAWMMKPKCETGSAAVFCVDHPLLDGLQFHFFGGSPLLYMRAFCNFYWFVLAVFFFPQAKC